MHERYKKQGLSKTVYKIALNGLWMLGWLVAQSAIAYPEPNQTMPSQRMPNQAQPGQLASQKIRFDWTELSPDGLIGEVGNRRAIDYEFCIPANEEYRQDVTEISPSVVIYPHSAGRIGCTSEQWLCIGNTHSPNGRAELLAIAQLPYVEAIEQTFWE